MAVDDYFEHTGMLNRPDVKQRLEDARANRAKLDSCKRHVFLLDRMPIPVPAGYRETCVLCGGKMGAHEAYAYLKGYIAAGGNPLDVMPTLADQIQASISNEG